MIMMHEHHGSYLHLSHSRPMMNINSSSLSNKSAEHAANQPVRRLFSGHPEMFAPFLFQNGQQQAALTLTLWRIISNLLVLATD